MKQKTQQPESFIQKKIKKLKSVYHKYGYMGTVSFCVNFLFAKTGWFRDSWILGRLVEILGNTVSVDGCHFNVSSPIIQTVRKSRFVLGRYERKERRAVHDFLDRSLPVIELGACIGVVSCITNKILQNPKNHVVVEANPDLIPLLTENRGLNKCSFTILNKASGYSSKETLFYQNEIFLSGSLQRETTKAIFVPTITLEEIFTNYNFDYANLICDIEGGEIDLISNEIDILSKKVFKIIVEVHPSVVGEEAINIACQKLVTSGFRKIPATVDYYGDVFIFENTKLKTLLFQK